jgi:hypothetical protein
MDEEDGRPGARAVQTGLIDAPRGVVTLPLQNPPPTPVPHPCDFFFIARVGTHKRSILGAPEPALSLSKGLAFETWVFALPQP